VSDGRKEKKAISTSRGIGDDWQQERFCIRQFLVRRDCASVFCIWVSRDGLCAWRGRGVLVMAIAILIGFSFVSGALEFEPTTGELLAAFVAGMWAAAFDMSLVYKVWTRK